MKRIGRRIFGSALVLLFAGTAQAQIDGPTPLLQGQVSHHLWSVPGVVNNGLATVFTCTNLTSGNVIVGVEVFGPAGGVALNDASSTSLTLDAGATGMFGAQPTVGLLVDSDLSVGLVNKGSARILATARRGVVCSAWLADPGNLPPIVMVSLNVIKKTTQWGD